MARPSSHPRLGPADWIMAGFRALASGGPSALRIDAMAAELGATKGSFYWHFKDLPEFRQAMLAAWEQTATTRITETVANSGLDGKGKLAMLAAMVSVDPGPVLGGVGIEPAIRDWARGDPLARAVQERVDCQRLADLHGFFAEAGHPDPAAAARTIYAAVIGAEALRLTVGIDMAAELSATLDRLFQPVNAASKG